MQSKNINIDGIAIRYLTAGHGTPLLVIHGGSSGASTWAKNIEELADSYKVYVPDLPGFGSSQPVEGNYYMTEMVDFIESFTNKLGLDRFHLMGHSFGGGIALNYVLKFPFKVSRLVLVSSMFLGKDIAFWVWLTTRRIIVEPLGWLTINLFRTIKWLAATVFNSIDYVVPVSEASVRIGKGIATLQEQARVMAGRLPEIAMPTLVIWGEKDPILPYKHAYAAAQSIPDCRVKIFEGSGHSVYRDRVEEFTHLLKDFLD